jgi:altronate hydrolase
MTMSSAAQAIRIHPSDPVAVAITEIAQGTTVVVDGVAVTVSETIPAGHKFAIEAIAPGAPVRKYGWPIGTAIVAIAPGAWVHVHNVKTALGGVETYAYEPAHPVLPDPGPEPTFQGYRRADGQVGIRNEVWIITTVGCVNTTAQKLAADAHAKLAPGCGVDAVVALTHPFGCSQLGDDHQRTRALLASLARHPNAAGVLVLGLGCENNAIKGMKEAIGIGADDHGHTAHIRFLATQEEGDEFEAANAILNELVAAAGKAKRVAIPARELRIGLKCGGSDGFSGITANSLLGSLSERLSGWHGTSVLTEVPEMFGAERILMARCVNGTVFDATVGLVNGFKEYYLAHNQPVFENPSPGNKAGGITTLEEKSLGCTQKGGGSPVVEVIPYAGRIQRGGGLCLLEAPGNDIVSVTALSAAGCHLVLFTTGRGTPLGGPVPVVKVASNSPLAERKPGWIDFDAGRLLTGMTRAQLLDDLTDTVLAIASGRQTKAEQRGQRDLAIFKDGVTL